MSASVPPVQGRLSLQRLCLDLLTHIGSILFLFSSWEKQSGAAMYSAMPDFSDSRQIRIQEVQHQTLQYPGLLQEDRELVPAGSHSHRREGPRCGTHSVSTFLSHDFFCECE